MSYDNKGSMVSSVVVAQDGTGNFNCNGTNDQVDIGNALTHANRVGADTLRFKAGTYDINNLTISNDVRIIADETGVIWDLPASPSLTTTATVEFEGITFQSTFDNTGHVLLGGDTYFRFCPFNLQLDTESSLVGIIRSNAGSVNRVEFLSCTLIGGEAGAQYFTFFDTIEDMKELIVRDFLISSLICNDGATGRFAIFLIHDDIDYFEASNIEVRGLDNTYDSSAFFHVPAGSTVTHVKMDGFLFHEDNTWTNNNSSFAPIYTFDSGVAAATIGSCVLSNFQLFDRSHAVVHGAHYLEVVNYENISPAVIGGGSFNAFDCGTTSSYPCYASFNNVTTVDGSLTNNTGWCDFKVVNSTFISSRIAVLMEVADTDDDPRSVEVTNCKYRWEAGGKYNYWFTLGYAQQRGIYLERMHVSDSDFYLGNTVFNVDTPSAPSGNPTFIMLSDLTVHPTIDSVNPRLFRGNPRSADDQIVWVFDSDIATNTPPLGDWNALNAAYTGVNDRVNGCRFDDNGTITYSENQGTATVPNGAAVSAAIPHGIACVAGTAFPVPGSIQITGITAHIETTEMVRDTLTATTFLVQFVGGGNVTGDRIVDWRARLTR